MLCVYALVFFLFLAKCAHSRYAILSPLYDVGAKGLLEAGGRGHMVCATLGATLLPSGP